MDKYNNNELKLSSRTKKNQELYEAVKNSSLTDFNINSNVSIIDDNASSIDVNKIKKILDHRYNEEAPKRKSIDIPDFEEVIIEEPLMDTKEYDINAILKKAKEGKKVDYNKERLKQVRDAQYEILHGLNLEIKKVEEPINKDRKAQEENLMNLINTITQLEIKNKEAQTNTDLDLLSDLSDEEPNVIDESDLTQPQKEVVPEKEEPIVEEEEKQEPVIKSREDHIEETLSKLNIDIDSYDDFSDISKHDSWAVLLKILAFIVIIILVIGAVYILNNMLDLGLF